MHADLQRSSLSYYVFFFFFLQTLSLSHFTCNIFRPKTSLLRRLVTLEWHTNRPQAVNQRDHCLPGTLVLHSYTAWRHSFLWYRRAVVQAATRTPNTRTFRTILNSSHTVFNNSHCLSPILFSLYSTIPSLTVLNISYCLSPNCTYLPQYSSSLTFLQHIHYRLQSTEFARICFAQLKKKTDKIDKNSWIWPDASSNWYS